ncbi:glycosyltransferase [Flavihumibacter fluvii]|uniref:glycosyltransferase n=1 Tax=Flavihumibacter fluvii TaxID=2838157 RepID=UPI001BDE047A|nr:glycosyltransferase [Flavihumibacter fluvii]ULQ53837.1 glycosyltransferase [Flavihumibacter fluvii]
MQRKIIFTITNDPDFDQRMQRICSSLHEAGYRVVLAGRKMREGAGNAPAYRVKRMRCIFHKGPLLYAEYHIRLFTWLLFQPADILCAIDIDTILPVYFTSILKGSKRVYDAHEYFSELKEVVTRPSIQRWWKRIEDFAIPRFPVGYTVGQQIATVFKNQYGVDYSVIRNVPNKQENIIPAAKRRRAILYQGAINEARGLEYLIPAMENIDAELHIYGSGNFESACFALVNKLALHDKVKFFGMVAPTVLQEITPCYLVGINLVEPVGLNQYYSLANKFFDYIHGAVPQVTMNFPEYALINENAQVAILLDDLQTGQIATAVNLLLHDVVLYEKLVENCARLRDIYCWELEKNRLLEIYEKQC